MIDLPASNMFKHIIKKQAGSEVTSSDSETDLNPEETGEVDLDEYEEFAGFGEDEGDEGQDGGEEDLLEQADDDEEEGEQEQLPANLPSLQEAVTMPIFEVSADVTGRKTVREASQGYVK